MKIQGQEIDTNKGIHISREQIDINIDMMEVLKDRHKVTYVAVPGAKNTKLQCNRI